MNEYFSCNHPNIYAFINLIKINLKQIYPYLLRFIKRMNGARSKIYRRLIDIKIDDSFSLLKTLFFY